MTVYHHDFHTDSLHPFWTAGVPASDIVALAQPAVVDVRGYPVVDDVSIVNPDGSETPLARHAGRVDVSVRWHTTNAMPERVTGLTAPTLLPPAIAPGGLEPVDQQPFLARWFTTAARGSFRADALADDGSLSLRFEAHDLGSAFAEVGFESVGVPPAGP